jgi:hypothetical protein
MKKRIFAEKESSFVRVSGGLGNQLFQYCFAKSVESETQKDVKLDFDSYRFTKHAGFRNIELTRLLNVSSTGNSKNYFTDSFSLPIFGSALQSKVMQRREFRVRNSQFWNGKKVIRETKFPFDPNVPFSTSAYYVGNFISMEYWGGDHESYFADITSKLSSFVGEIDAIPRLNPENTVVIHSRRGDYVSNSKTRNFHGYCKDSYYLQAVQKLSEENSNITHCLISSDDSSYAFKLAEMLGRNGFDCSINTQMDPITTLQNLSVYKYLIGSNSTYSWWIAFLGVKKKIIFPSEWFISTKGVINPTTFYPFLPILLENALTNLVED